MLKQDIPEILISNFDEPVENFRDSHISSAEGIINLSAKSLQVFRVGLYENLI